MIFSSIIELMAFELEAPLSTSALTVTILRLSARLIEAKPRPYSMLATLLKGTSEPSRVRTRMFSMSPRERRSASG